MKICYNSSNVTNLFDILENVGLSAPTTSPNRVSLAILLVANRQRDGMVAGGTGRCLRPSLLRTFMIISATPILDH
jgi:hypothetical protein